MVGQGKGRIDSAEANQAGEQHQPQIVVVPDAVENLYDLGWRENAREVLWPIAVLRERGEWVTDDVGGKPRKAPKKRSKKAKQAK